MKQKTIYGTLLATFLMISLAFVQPVTADATGVNEVVDAVDHISGIAYDDNFQLYIEQLVNDPELTAMFEAVLSAEDNAQLENLLQEFTMVLESNPAYIDLMSYIDTAYGEDIAILQAFSQEATTEDMHTVINSVVSPDGTVVGDNDAPADLSATEEESSSGLSAPEGEETTDIIPVIDPIDPTDPIYVGDLYPVYAPSIGIKDTSYNCILQGGEASVYIPGVGTIPWDLYQQIITGDLSYEDFENWQDWWAYLIFWTGIMLIIIIIQNSFYQNGHWWIDGVMLVEWILLLFYFWWDMWKARPS